MKKLLNWLKQSNRYKHLIAGVAIGALTTTAWNALVAVGVAGATAEFKDRQWGGKWDWVDLCCTLVGGALGFGLHVLIWQIWK